MRTFTRYEIEVVDLFNSELRLEAERADADGSPWEVGRIVVDGSQNNTAEYLAVDDRIGMAWGTNSDGDADWADLILAPSGDIQESVDAAIARWLDDD